MNDAGELFVTLPRFASERHAQSLVDSSRDSIRLWRAKHAKQTRVFHNNDTIGRSHVLRFQVSNTSAISVKHRGLTIVVEYPVNLFETDPRVQRAAKPAIDKALQKEARAYLPRRLSYLAEHHGFQYAKIRFGTQKGRWGSCSSHGTISLNVGLMLLEPELIDYVLVHELCHTKQMNHSTMFWSCVEACLPDYKARRKLLKTRSPHL